MAEEQGFLSQKEIDALLAAIPAESEAVEAAVQAPKTVSPPPPANTRRYDFRQADKLSKDQVRALRMIHETWARRVSVSLSAFLRSSIEVSLADIDQGIYMSLVQQIPDQGIYYILSPSPLPGHLMLHVSLDLGMIVLDRMMGGVGAMFKSNRGLTELEVGLLRAVIDKLLVDLQEAWASTTPISPRIDDISINHLLVPVALPNDAIVWVSFEVRLKGNTSGMILGIPYSLLKPIANRLKPYTGLSNPDAGQRDSANQQRKYLETSLADVTLPVSVVLGSTRLSLEELTSLRPGDVLPLNTAIDAPCQLLVNGNPKFLGRPGLCKRQLGVQIERVVQVAVSQEEASGSRKEITDQEGI
ncbi:MAG: FliM/FliN family flagellar motor switch protein [Anaerolineae bacterium]|nr:FliM/FliN family flagellar motor switch protein [Anaerolineae bacterium]